MDASGFVWMWSFEGLSAGTRPAPKTCAWGAPDDGIRGYTIGFGVHERVGGYMHILGAARTLWVGTMTLVTLSLRYEEPTIGLG